jgi:Putative transposase
MWRPPSAGASNAGSRHESRAPPNAASKRTPRLGARSRPHPRQARTPLDHDAAAKSSEFAAARLPSMPLSPGDSALTCPASTLQAATRVAARDRDGLERMARYLARPPIANDRLTRLDDGRLQLELKRPWRDGTTAFVFTPHELIERLVALVPRPRTHLTRYFGVFAPAFRRACRRRPLHGERRVGRCTYPGVQGASSEAERVLSAPVSERGSSRGRGQPARSAAQSGPGASRTNLDAVCACGFGSTASAGSPGAETDASGSDSEAGVHRDAQTPFADAPRLHGTDPDVTVRATPLRAEMGPRWPLGRSRRS